MAFKCMDMNGYLVNIKSDLCKNGINYWYALYSLPVLVSILLICTNKWWKHWLFIMSFIFHFVWLIYKIFRTFIICNSSTNHKHSNKQSMLANTSHEVEANPMDNSCEMLELNSNGNSDKQNKLLSLKIITIFAILVCGTYEYCQCLFRKILNVSNKIGHYNDDNVINIILHVERFDINKLNTINIKEEINYRNITPKQFVNDINNSLCNDIKYKNIMKNLKLCCSYFDDIIIDKSNKQRSATNENMNKICVLTRSKTCHPKVILVIVCILYIIWLGMNKQYKTIMTFGLLMILYSNIKATQSVNLISCISWE
eukprot:799609_1